MRDSLEAIKVRNAINESLSEPREAFPAEGNMCDFPPCWSYSNRLAKVTSLHIEYDDGTFFTLDAPKGMPGPSFPGYLDTILYFGQSDLFSTNYVEISKYQILDFLGFDPKNGAHYNRLNRDLDRAFSITMKTDRFIHPQTRKRSHTDHFRVLSRMRVSKRKDGISQFYFDDLFLQSLRSGYLKRLDIEFCLDLDKKKKALARFLYSHILKRLGTNSEYVRKIPGFLSDVGLAYLLELKEKNRRQKIKQVLYPSLDVLKGHAFYDYTVDPSDNIRFLS